MYMYIVCVCARMYMSAEVEWMRELTCLRGCMGLFREMATPLALFSMNRMILTQEPNNDIISIKLLKSSSCLDIQTEHVQLVKEASIFMMDMSFTSTDIDGSNP